MALRVRIGTAWRVRRCDPRPLIHFNRERQRSSAINCSRTGARSFAGAPRPGSRRPAVAAGARESRRARSSERRRSAAAARASAALARLRASFSIACASASRLSPLLCSGRRRMASSCVHATGAGIRGPCLALLGSRERCWPPIRHHLQRRVLRRRRRSAPCLDLRGQRLDRGRRFRRPNGVLAVLPIVLAAPGLGFVVEPQRF